MEFGRYVTSCENKDPSSKILNLERPSRYVIIIIWRIKKKLVFKLISLEFAIFIFSFSYIISLLGHVQRAYLVAWSADSRLLASGSKDSTLKGKLFYFITQINLNYIFYKIINDFKLILQSVIYEYFLNNYIYSIIRFKLNKHCPFVNPGFILILFLVWSMKTNKFEAHLPGHADEVFALDWSPDSRFVASGGKDKILKL